MLRKTTRGAKNEAVEFIGVLIAVGAGGEVLIEQEILVGLGVVNRAELFFHDIKVGLSAGVGKFLGGLIAEVVTVFGNGVLVGGTGGAQAGIVNAGLLGGTRVAAGAKTIGVVALGVATAAGGGAVVSASGGTALDDIAGVFSVEIAEFLTVGEIVAEFGARHGVFGEVVLAALFGVGGGPAGETTADGAHEAVQAGADSAEDGARHFEERYGEEEREDLEGETDNDAEQAVGR